MTDNVKNHFYISLQVKDLQNKFGSHWLKSWTRDRKQFRRDAEKEEFCFLTFLSRILFCSVQFASIRDDNSLLLLLQDVMISQTQILQQLQAHCLFHSSVHTEPEHDAVQQHNRTLCWTAKMFRKASCCRRDTFYWRIIKYTDRYIKE